MSNYLFIESRDPFESADTKFIEQSAVSLRQRGHTVTVFLVQNGVLAARRAAMNPYLDRLAQARVTLLADGFSLQERGIESSDLRAGIQASTIETLVDIMLQEQTKAIWH
jgi:sulfur transfer complex TusBCD TusB component (DsrH family)